MHNFTKNDVNLFIITSHASYHPSMHVLYEYVDCGCIAFVYMFANACISFVTAGCVSIIGCIQSSPWQAWHIQGGKYSTRDKVEG